MARARGVSRALSVPPAALQGDCAPPSALRGATRLATPRAPRSPPPPTAHAPRRAFADGSARLTAASQPPAHLHYRRSQVRGRHPSALPTRPEPYQEHLPVRLPLDPLLDARPADLGQEGAPHQADHRQRHPVAVLEIVDEHLDPLITRPVNPQHTLGIKLLFLVMIIKNLKKDFSFEVQVLDDKNVRCRFRVELPVDDARQAVHLHDADAPRRGVEPDPVQPLRFTRRARTTTEMLRIQIHAVRRIRRIYFSTAFTPRRSCRPSSSSSSHPQQPPPRFAAPPAATEALRSLAATRGPAAPRYLPSVYQGSAPGRGRGRPPPTHRVGANLDGTHVSLGPCARGVRLGWVLLPNAVRARICAAACFSRL